MEKRVSVVAGSIKVGDSCRRFCDIASVAQEKLENKFQNRSANDRIEVVEVDITCTALKLYVDKDFRCQQKCQAKISARAYDINAHQVDSFEVPPSD